MILTAGKSMRYLIGPTVIVLVSAPLLFLLAESWKTSYLNSSAFKRGAFRADVKQTLKTEDDINIAPGTLPGQLDDLLNSRQVSYFYVFEDVANIRGNPVHGRLSVAAALRGLLHGTGCVYHESAKTLAIACEEAADPGHVRVR
jgi:hypothetical protein